MLNDCLEYVDCYGYEGLFQVTKYGDVKSVSRIVIRKNGRPLTIKEKELTIRQNKDGYFFVQLHINGENHPKLVHKLVWETFYGEVPEGLEIGHWDGDNTNNCLSNLYLCTHITNCNHTLTRQRQSKRMKGNTISKGLASKNRKKIVCLDLNKKFVKMYDYISQVINDGFSIGNVSMCCHNKYGKKGNVTKNKIFMFEDDYEKMLGV